ncbi:Uncharacterized protein PBTT_09933 [Plasmodiophora brassicae]|uniref:Uncharacterized protein n=1 Tax=Plasmodiophora brassicae TaxID=37360 RepID=A0A0G4J1W2_PLABS|nr:hypothetical protein PBRA_001877 [Plasmodiophora brassicae]SPR01308.1 unnamed protein product [Plasmodiophora brassicae]
MAAAATTLQPVVIVAPSRVPRGFMPAMTASGQFRVRTDDSIAPSLIIPSAVSVACVVAAEDQWLVHVHREKLLENCTRVCKTFQQSFLLCIISTELGRQLLLEFQSKNLRSLPQVVMCKSVDDVPKVVACLVRAFRGETSASRERRVKQLFESRSGPHVAREVLSNMPGVDPQEMALLQDCLGSIKRISQATPAEMTRSTPVSSKTAAYVARFFSS